MNNNFIYFPSFSVGNFSIGMKDNLKLDGGLPYRFYSTEFPEKYRHPYFLVTAGHFYKKFNFKEEWGFNEYDDTLLFGDSGGFQVASGAIKWDNKLKETILKWLEHNSDVAMNLDIPPRLTYAGKFNDCLELSKNNFKYFADNQTGKTQFLNVIQGDDEISYKKWYDTVKDFEFQGWGIGGAGGSLFRFMSGIMVLMQGKEQYKKNNKWLHILGTSKILHILILSQLHKSLKDINSNMRVSTDSSTPSRGVVYGDMYTYPDFKNSKWRVVNIPTEKMKGVERYNNKHSTNDISSHFLLPQTCEFDDLLINQYTHSDILSWNNNATVAIIMHNFMLFKDVIKQCGKNINTHPYILEQLINPDQFLILNAIDEMVKAYENDTTPEIVFKKYKPHFLKMSSDQSLKMSSNTIQHDFFN